MDKILEFLDFSSIDPQMYWRVPSQDGLKSYEVNWRRDSTIHWRFREYGELFWTLSTTETLLGNLREHKIDLICFEENVKTSLLHQVCFADRIVKDSRQLLGADLVEAGIKDHEEFLQNIGNLVDKLHNKGATNATIPPFSSPTFRLHVVKDEL